MTIAILSAIDLAAVAIVGAIVCVAVFGTQRRVSIKLGNLSATVDQVHGKVDAVDHAVNSRSFGAQTISEDVRELRAQLSQRTLLIADMAAQLGRLHDVIVDVSHKTDLAATRAESVATALALRQVTPTVVLADSKGTS